MSDESSRESGDLLGLVPPWTVEEEDELAETSIFTLHRRRCTSPRTGRTGDFVYLEVPDWVNVIALTADREVVMIEQFRHGLVEVTLEIPGGTVDPGEDPVQAGLRELREETGFVGSGADLIGAVAPNPAIQDNLCHTVLVRDVRPEGETEPEGLEEIEVRLVEIDRIADLVRWGVINHALVVAAFHHLSLQPDRGAAAGRDATGA